MKPERSCVVFGTMKNHTTVTITKEMLEDLRACPGGIAGVIDILPIKISTDPEKNLNLAIRMADHPRALEGRHDVRWLAARVVGDHDNAYAPSIGDNYIGDLASGNYEARDVMLIQQQLAMIADTIATKEGR